jgi:DNA-binding PadR family transcriptional regulator
MAKRKISNLLALAVLSLLTERPMHPYEVSSVMKLRELSTVIKLNYSSLYSLMETLHREGLIEPIATQREGRYPERTVYATTEAGRDELRDWLRSLLRQPAIEYTQFAAGLAFVGNLPPAEVVVLLEEHLLHLQEQMSSIHSTIERAINIGVDRLFLVEDRYTFTLLEARFAFIQRFIEEVKDGTLTETIDGQLAWKITRPELGLLGSDAEKEQGKAEGIEHQDH